MQWELVATWLGLFVTVGGVVFAMGKQSQKIENQKEQIDALFTQIEKAQELPVKLATLETDIKYLIREFSDIKQMLMRRVGE